MDDAKAAVPTEKAKDLGSRAKSAVKSNLPVGAPAPAFDARLLQKNASQALNEKVSNAAKQAGSKVRVCGIRDSE